MAGSDEVDLAFLRPDGNVELLVADLSLARAFYGSVPSARLLARVVLGRDSTDATAWDTLLCRLAGGPSDAVERVRRAIARQMRAALDEGPLAANTGTTATLVYAVSLAEDGASMAETFSDEANARVTRDAVARACAVYDERLAAPGVDLRIPLFEACVRLATTGSAGPWSAPRFLEARRQLADAELGLAWTCGPELGIFPEIDPAPHARMALVRRDDVDALVARDPRELASSIARIERERGERGERGHRAHLDSFVADMGHLLRHSGSLFLASVLPDPEADEPIELSPPSERPSSIPLDWAQGDVALTVAESLEHGQTTVSRLKSLVSRGGEPALDAIGAQMLRVQAHPTASAAFAEVLARAGRARDVIRLVTYFAVAPDPTVAAHALSSCAAPELPIVLRAWLEAMLPSDGGAVPFGDDPYTSSAARVTACVASLAPYPHLYRAVRPLLSRVSEAPPATIND